MAVVGITPEEAKGRLENFRDKPFRSNQKEAIEFAANSPQPFKIIEAPTGSGKSLMGMTLAMMNRKTNYLCGTKILQSQLSEDFPEGVTLWGRDNYTCLKNDEFTCNHCTATRFDPCNEECVYKREKSRALESQVRILNYSYYLSEVQYAGKFRNSDLTIIDEADSLESTLIGFISLEFTDSDLFKLGMANGPRRKTTDAKDGVQSWIEFGEVAHAKSKRKAAELKAEVDSWDTIEEEWQLRTMKELERMVHINERCAMFLDNVDKSWILEQQDRVGKFQGKLIFRPLWITPELAEKYLWKHSKSWVLMSAAFLPKPVLAKILGIDEGDMDWGTVPSTFPIENRPINIWPVCDLKYSNMKEEVPKLIKGIRKVLNRHRGQKGLIHCSSYSLAKMIVEGVDDERLITHGNKDRQAVVDHFVGSHGDAVLVSPSLERGINLPDDQCFHPDTLIRTSLGYKKISDIKIGDRVFTHNGRYRRVLATRERAYTGTMIKIKTYGGKETRVTPGHPILVDKYGNRKPYFHPVLGKWIGSPKPVKTSKAWKNSEELKKGDSILLPSGEQSMYFKPLGRKHITTKRVASKTIEQAPYHWDDTEEFWELIGLWMAEGSLTIERTKRPGKGGNRRIHYKIVFSFGWHEEHTLARRCCGLVEKAIGNKRPTPKVHGRACIVSFKNDALGVWLKKNIGVGSKNKRIPTRIMKAKNKEHQEAFLAGICNGDGYYNQRNNCIVVGLANELVTIQLRNLALQLGYTASCGPRTNSGVDKNGKQTSAWRTTISLHNEFAINCLKGYQRTKIRGISTEQYSGSVYNLQVEQDESYTTDCLCAHNCRFQIVAKAPFLSLADKVVNKRVHSGRIGQMWYSSSMMLAVLQAAGRGVRHESDYCECYILDKAVERAYELQPSLWPEWFRSAVTWGVNELV